MESIETVGASAGREAAGICKARTADGDIIRRLLSEKVKAANLEAQQLQDSESEDQRAIAIFGRCWRLLARLAQYQSSRLRRG